MHQETYNNSNKREFCDAARASGFQEPLDISPDPGDPSARQPALREPALREPPVREQPLRELPLTEQPLR
jgi:hypothetical protein